MKTRRMSLTTLLAVAALSLVAALAPAQNVNKRLQNQNKRINQGIKDGQLTRNQVDALRSKDASVRARELNDRAHDNGKLTPRERANLNKSLNKDSKAIYRDRHDAAAKGG